MAAVQKGMDPKQRIQLTAHLLAHPEDNRTQIAQQYQVSRQTLYTIARTGQQALSACFSPASLPPLRSTEGFWVWVDANAIKRLIILLRALCGATLLMIARVLLEAFSLQVSQETIRHVIQESYKKAHLYRNNVDLSCVERATFDEMYRWGRCVVTGVDADSLFLFLCEKQPGRGNRVWQPVMNRLRKQQHLNPGQIAVDGLSALETSASVVWPEARLVHDINHLRRAIEKVRTYYEQQAYRAIDKTERTRLQYLRCPPQQNSSEKRTTRLAMLQEKERVAVEQSEEVSNLVEQAQQALHIIHPLMEQVNEPSQSQSLLASLAKRFQVLAGTFGVQAGNYLEGVGQKIVAERAVFIAVMERLARQQQVSFQAVEQAAYLWELNKQYQAASWSGTKEAIRRTMKRVGHQLERLAGEQTLPLLENLCREFRAILAASSPVEWSHSQIGAVLEPQKRISSGWLGLRVAYLNLRPFSEGVRQGQSPHELLTGEVIEDWLVKLGYAPRNQEVRSLKKLGWRRLVGPVVPSWRENWVNSQQFPSSLDGTETPLADVLVDWAEELAGAV